MLAISPTAHISDRSGTLASRSGSRTSVSTCDGAGETDTSRAGGVQALSLKTRFRGPLVAQTSVRRLAQPCGAEPTVERKAPANERVQGRSSPGVVVPDSACHAGGRGFESRRSRLLKCLQTGTSCCLSRRSNLLRGPIPWPKRLAQNACKIVISWSSLYSGRTNPTGSQAMTGRSGGARVARYCVAGRVCVSRGFGRRAFRGCRRRSRRAPQGPLRGRTSA
jgi:hypothetical protein